MNLLLSNTLASTSYSTYKRAWDAFQAFWQVQFQNNPVLPVSTQCTALYIAYLSQKGYAASTIRTYLSVLAHVHKLLGLQSPTTEFLPKKLLDAIDRSSAPGKKLLPITITLLHRMLEKLPQFVSHGYNLVLFRALLLSLYHLCARVGELTVSQGNTHNILQLQDLSLVNSNSKVSAFRVRFTNFKHNLKSTPHSITVVRNSHKFCPVKAMLEYLKVRGPASGHIFINQFHCPLSALDVSNTIRSILASLSLDSASYGTHSFRIGYCTDSAVQGASTSQLRLLGSWHSHAFLKYIHPQDFQVKL